MHHIIHQNTNTEPLHLFHILIAFAEDNTSPRNSLGDVGKAHWVT